MQSCLEDTATGGGMYVVLPQVLCSFGASVVRLIVGGSLVTF